MTEAQELLRIHLRELGIETVPEHKFCVGRKWAFDLASEELRVGFECCGNLFGGGHRRGKKTEDWYERNNWAQLNGWRVLSFSNRQILSGEAKSWLQENL